MPPAATARDTPALPPRLVLLGAVVSVGISAILIRWVDDAPAASIAFYRLFLTTLALTPVVFLRHRAQLAALAPRDLVIALAVGFVLAVHFATWIESLFHTSVASSVIIVSTEALLAAIAAAVFLGERLAPSRWALIGLAFAGVTLIALGDAGGAGADKFPNALYGDFLAFIGAVAAAAYLVVGRSVRQRVPLLVYVFVVYWSCTVFLFLFAVSRDAPLEGFSGRTWLLFALMALGPQIGGHTLYNWCLRYLPAATVSTTLLGEPLIAALLAALLFAEIPGALGLAGGALALLGILGVIREGKSRPASETGIVGPA